MKVREAYEASGYSGKSWALWDMRNNPEVKARIEWLLEERVRSRTRRRSAAEKRVETDEAIVMQKLRNIVQADVRNVVQWKPKAQFDEDGNLVGIINELAVTPSKSLTPDQAAAIKSVFIKAGEVRFEMHDSLKAAVDLGRMIGLGQPDTPPPPPSAGVTFNQVNIGNDAVSAARKVAFLLSAAAAQAHPATPALELKAEPEEK